MATTDREDHLVSYVSDTDVETVLARVPENLRVRVRDVFHTRDSRGVRRLGFVRRRGRRDIVLCSMLPPRVSLRGFIVRGQSASEFGAPPRGQWPPWAVRRFLLYDTLLHELGHLQLVRPKGRGWNRKFASETLAQRFADELRRELFSQHFAHPDPIHNPPEPDEQSLLPVWTSLDKLRRYRLVCLALAAPHADLPEMAWLGELSVTQRGFVERALLHHCDDTAV